MPIARLSAEDANRNMRRNRASLWPDDRIPGERLTGVAKVTTDPSFAFSREDQVLTLGSCFAREMGNQLEHMGFRLPTQPFAKLLTKYTIQSIENELLWASGEPPPPPDKLFLELGDGVWCDPHLVNLAPNLPLEQAVERRTQVTEALAGFPQCRLVIITLGLAEAWFDHETLLYLNIAPQFTTLKRHPGRFSLDVLAYDDVLGCLERIHALLTLRGHPDFKMLLTVSPVPLKATFSGQDSLTANTYSKAVQRAACEAFAARHGNVDYFPSYEVVSLSPRELVFERDNIHVTRPVVRHIMQEVLRRYAPDVEMEAEAFVPATPVTRGEAASDSPVAQLALAKHHMAREEHLQVIATCQQMLDRMAAWLTPRDLGACRFLYGAALGRLERWTEAATQIELAAAADPRDGVVHYKLGQAYQQLMRHDDAIAAFRQAVSMNSARPEFRERLEAALAQRDRRRRSRPLAPLRRLARWMKSALNREAR